MISIRGSSRLRPHDQNHDPFLSNTHINSPQLPITTGQSPPHETYPRPNHSPNAAAAAARLDLNVCGDRELLAVDAVGEMVG